ncbi:MAG: LON peptidase substrate-binding domain-containing protein [Opitutales bacterium]
MVEVEIPLELPVMTLSNVALFPRAMVPLYIFEPRYRQMLADVLTGDRMFILAGQNDAEAERSGAFEPPYPVATVGVVRASQLNDDETSNLVIQGLVRVRILEILQEEPYRFARVEPLPTQPGAPETELDYRVRELISSLEELRALNQEIPEELLDYLRAQEEPEAVVDLAAFAFCPDPEQKQALLAEGNVASRFRQLLTQLLAKRKELELEAKLRGKMSDDDIGKN